MESREDKFKQHRETIAFQNVKNDDPKDVITKEDKENLEENHIKKNTLAMSIDQIIEAHDEYTVSIEQKELETKIRLEKKAKRNAILKKVFKYIGVGVALLAIVVVIVIVILQILG